MTLHYGASGDQLKLAVMVKLKSQSQTKTTITRIMDRIAAAPNYDAAGRLEQESEW